MAVAVDTVTLISIGVWFFGGFITGITGLGASMIAIPLLAPFFPMKELIPACNLAWVAVLIYMGYVFRKDCQWQPVRHITIASIPGGLLGVWALKVAPNEVLLAVLGLILVVFSLWQLTHKLVKPRKPTLYNALVAGFVIGTTQTSLSVCGPPTAMYAVLMGWDRAASLGTMSIVFGIANTLCALIHWYAGLLTMPVIHMAATFFLANLLGVLLAVPLAKRLPTSMFRRMLLVMIGLAGAISLVRSLL